MRLCLPQRRSSFVNYTKNNPHEYCRYAVRPDDENIYAMITGLSGGNDEFASGEYIISINLGTSPLTDDPVITFMTPNGVTISPVTRISAVWYRYPAGMNGYLSSILLFWRDALSAGCYYVIRPTKSEIHRYTVASQEYNKTHLADIRALFVQDEV